MPRYLVQGSYTNEGLKALQRDKASGRRAAAEKAAKSAGGKLEAFYFAFGEDDVVVIAELPDQVSAAAMSLAISGAGLIQVRTTVLLTVDEIDQALGKKIDYKGR